MTDDASRAEFLSLVEELLNQLTYLRELGVEGIEAGGALAREAAAKDEPLARQETPSPRQSPAPSPPYSPALRRNAEAEARAPTAEVKPPVAPSRPAPPAKVLSQTKPESNEMATRKPVRTPDPVPPAPQETLFGEITPQDELSLPREGETLESIRADIGDCMRCPLCCEGRTKIVHSEGNQKARLMFVGEAPGANEDAEGRPFVGRAGQLLNKIIEAIGMKREDIFIGNVNRCRPANNRTPTSAEAAICKPFLLREIAIVRPDVIVVLGNTALHNLLDTKEGITKVRGQFKDYKGLKVMPTFHPAYLLRDPSKKRETWDDMKKVRDYLNKTKAEK
jgi:uracil-DNA glycosylase family 4